MTTVLAPVGGRAVPLQDVPDPVFSQGMVGYGAAVDLAGELIAHAVVLPAALTAKINWHRLYPADELQTCVRRVCFKF